MKVKTLKAIKYQGKLYQPDVELDVKKEIADELIDKEAAVAVSAKGESNESDSKG